MTKISSSMGTACDNLWHSEGFQKTSDFPGLGQDPLVGWSTLILHKTHRRKGPSILPERGRRRWTISPPPCLRLQVFMKLHGICRNRIQWSIIIYIFNHLWHYAEFSDTHRSLASHTLAFTSIYSRLYNQVLKRIKSMTIHENPSLMSSRGHSSGQSLEGSCQGYGKISAVEVGTVFKTL